jgi:hypothetical protein
MSAFADIFDSTSAFLRAKGIPTKVSKGRVAEKTSVQQFQKQTGMALPESFSGFFTGFADGFQFSWEKNEDIWGSISIPSLKELAGQQQEWKRHVRDFLEDPKSMDQCIDPPFRAEAFEIWQRMESWIPFLGEGNGDHFCVDSLSGQIIYDQHDWFDGFGSLAKTNGIVAGKTLEDFLRQWSRFCFRPNDSLWWGEFAGFGVIKWEAGYFDAEYCRDT